MKHIWPICLTFIFALAVQTAWGQTPDSTTRYKTVVTDRISEPADRERGPSLEKIFDRAEEAYARRDFYAAMKYYGFVLKSEPLHVKALKGYGESAFEITSLDSAQMAFQRLVDRGLSPAPNYFPKLRLAETKFRNADYDGAIVLYEELISIPQNPPIGPENLAIAKERKKFCEWALDVSDNPTVLENTFKMLDTSTINTREYSEYMAYPDDEHNQIYFSAYRFEFEKDRANPRRNLIKLLTASEKDERVGLGEVEFNDLKHQHTAHLSYSETGDAVYYALGDYVGKSAEIHFDLYRRKKQADGFWGLPEKLDALNSTEFTTTEPSVGTLPGEKFETLFFVSDRTGGRGGRDIWYSKILGDSLTAPMPLNSLNTPNNEVTPFYHGPSNTLYFSTDGGVTGNGDSLKTMGGFDVYKSSYTETKRWRTPRHMGKPINDSANDVFFAIGNKSERGYWSSNRRGDFNNSEEGCCYDIYAVDFILPKLKAIGYHKLTKEILPYTRISLYEAMQNGQLIPVANPQPDTGSTYPFNEVRLEKNYVLIAEKEEYSSDTLRFTTPDEVWREEIVHKLYLKPHVNLVANVYDGDTGEPIYGATAKFFDLGFRNEAGNFLSGKGEAKVDVLPQTSNRKEYKIDYEHKYQVLASKEGYVADISPLDSSEVVSTLGRVTGGTIEVNLYLHKPSALEEYLPVTLYFDNDYPKKDYPDQDTILLDYQKTFVNYIRRKDDYKAGFSQGLVGHAKQEAMDTIENFFENEVRHNWDKFFALSDKIDTMLQNGDTIILTLKGYASPLSNPTYNFHLTNRRIASVYNHFMIFDLGIFPKYREVGGNGQLRFIRKANGDSTAPPGLNKDPKNPRLSIYDVKASRERRVQIIGVRVSKRGNNLKM